MSSAAGCQLSSLACTACLLLQLTPRTPHYPPYSYDELSAHERIQVGGTKGGITTKEGGYGGHYQGEGELVGWLVEG